LLYTEFAGSASGGNPVRKDRGGGILLERLPALLQPRADARDPGRRSCPPTCSSVRVPAVFNERLGKHDATIYYTFESDEP
jgi:hypothetical protein